jgi:hypothetical protein
MEGRSLDARRERTACMLAYVEIKRAVCKAFFCCFLPLPSYLCVFCSLFWLLSRVGWDVGAAPQYLLEKIRYGFPEKGTCSLT